MAQTVRKLPAIQDTQVLSLSCEDSREEEMKTHSRSLAWRIQRTEEPSVLWSTRL